MCSSQQHSAASCCMLTAWGFPELAKLSKEFLPQVECAYFIHNFKGSRPGGAKSCGGCAQPCYHHHPHPALTP